MTSSWPRPFDPHLHLNGELPFCDLRTINVAYADAEARGYEAGIESLLQTFNFSEHGAFPKVRHGRKVAAPSAEALSGNNGNGSKDRT